MLEAHCVAFLIRFKSFCRDGFVKYTTIIDRNVMQCLNHYGLMTPYGKKHLDQHWLGQWLLGLRHQAITWINVDISSRVFCGIHLRAISQLVFRTQSVTYCTFKKTTTSLRGPWSYKAHRHHCVPTPVVPRYFTRCSEASCIFIPKRFDIASNSDKHSVRTWHSMFGCENTNMHSDSQVRIPINTGLSLNQHKIKEYFVFSTPYPLTIHVHITFGTCYS